MPFPVLPVVKSLTYGIVVAVQEELKAFLRRMPRAEVESVGGISFYRGSMGGQAVILAKSGMGWERAEKAAHHLLTQYRPDVLIIAGFCAGLEMALAPGTLVVVTEVLDSVDSIPQRAEGRHLYPDGMVQEQVEHVLLPGVTIHCGKLVTAAQVVVSTADKREQYRNFDSPAALDMETAGAARASKEAGVPWGAIRAVTDGYDDSLPFDFQKYADSQTGEVNPARLAVAALLHPSRIPALLRLGQRAALAGRNLAAFVETYLRENPG